MQSNLTAETGFWDFVWPQVIRGIGMMTCFMAIMRPTLISLPPELVPSGTGVFNLMRNLGGAFGLASLTTLQQHSFALHRQELYAAADTQAARDAIAASAARFELEGLADPKTAALSNYLQLLDREALVMTFNNQFLVIAIAMAVATVAVIALKKPDESAPRAVLSDSH
jgi:DHA2 family multidrug resistance protein